MSGGKYEKMLNETFYSNNMSGGGNGVVRRIRTPGQHDVLSGRGGSVNAHPGNIYFREELVAPRRVDYNLAHSKQDKADICRSIIDQIEALGGRFLAKESPNSQFWVELDEERIMAKTSQALREGAPKIREQHRDELGNNNKNAKRRRSSARSARATSNSSFTKPAARPPQKQPEDQQAAATSPKRVRVDYNGFVVRPNQASPALEAQDDNNALLGEPEPYQLNASLAPAVVPPPVASLPPPPNHHHQRNDKLHREHSLADSALSSSYADLSEPFVNPFENETETFFLQQQQQLPPTFRLPSPPPRLGVIRDSTNHSADSDYAGLGALLHHRHSSPSNHNSSDKSNNSNHSQQQQPQQQLFRNGNSNHNNSGQQQQQQQVRSIQRRNSGGSRYESPEPPLSLYWNYSNSNNDELDNDNDDWFIPVSP